MRIANHHHLTMAQMGKPTILETHPEKAEAIIENLSVGASRTDAVLAASCTYQSFLNWIEWGRDAKNRQENGERLTKREKLYLDFFERVTAAEAQCAIDMQIVVYSGAVKDPQLALRWLEVRRPEQYGRNNENRFTVQARVENSGTVTQNVNHSLDPTTAKEVIDILALAGAFDVATKADSESVDDAQADS